MWEALAARRKELGMKFDTLSKLSGVPETTLKKVLTGVTTNPKMTTVKAIAGALEMTISELDNRACARKAQWARKSDGDDTPIFRRNGGRQHEF